MKRWVVLSLCLLQCLSLPLAAMGADARSEGLAAMEPMTDEARIQAIEEILAMAAGEIGYTEGPGGYSKYGDWAGGAYKEWCSEFVSWCVDQVDLMRDSFLLGSLYPMQATCNTGVEWYTQRGRYVTVKGEIKGWGTQWYLEDGVPVAERPYVPKRGDCIYIEWYKYNRIDHVGLVEMTEVDETNTVQVYTVEGNNPDSVMRFSYPLYDEGIRAYGTSTRVVGTEMRNGCKGPVVVELQEALANQGFLEADKIDGVYGSGTVKAVKEAQAAFELDQTGVADKDTQKALGLW